MIHDLIHTSYFHTKFISTVGRKRPKENKASHRESHEIILPNNEKALEVYDPHRSFKKSKGIS